MKIEEIFNKIDELFQQGKVEEAEMYMDTTLAEAEAEGDFSACVALYNELAGYCRVSGNKEKCFDMLQKALAVQENEGLGDTISYATTLLNKATACAAFDINDEAFALYKKVEAMYEKLIDKDDFRVASLYNNMSSVLLKSGDLTKGIDYLEKSKDILEKLTDSQVETATCNTNIALLKTAEGRFEEAEDNLQAAYDFFAGLPNHDVHFDSTLAAFGNLRYRQKRFEEAAGYFAEAAANIEKAFGKNYNYAAVCHNCALSWEAAGNSEKADEYEKMAEEGRK